MRAAALVLATALNAQATANAQESPLIDVKGVALGANEQELKHLFPFARCVDEKNKLLGDRLCTVFKTTYAEAPAIITFAFMNDRLANIVVGITPSDYNQIVRAMVSKFGAPTSTETKPETTRSGATFSNEIAKWSLPSGEITASKFGSSITSGLITVHSREGKREIFLRFKELQQKRERDL